MFVIVYNNNVILGPMKWNRYRFENEIQDECEVPASLPDRNDNGDVITVADNIKIYPVQGTPDPEFNSTIETLAGPFWTYTDTAAISHYTVQPLPIEIAKGNLKTRAAAERYRREVAGTIVTVQGTEVSVATDRDGRSVINQAYLLAGDSDTVQWKFNEAWLTLTKADLGTVTSAISAYVQEQFNWEVAKAAEIDACTTLEQLAAIEIEPAPVLPNIYG